MLSKYLNTIAFAFIDNVSKVLSVLVVNAIIARILDVSAFGQYSYYVFLSSFFISISKFGLENVILLESARLKKDKFLNILNSSFALRAIFALVLSVIAILLYNSLAIPLKYIAIISIPLFLGIFDFSELYFLANQKNKIITVGKFLLSILSLLLRIAVFFLEPQYSFEILVFLYILDFLCIMILHCYMLKKEGLLIRLSYVNRTTLIMLSRRGALLLGAGMSIFIIMRINTFFLEKYCTFYDLGIYSPAIKICELSNAFIILIINVLTPLIVNDSLQEIHKKGIYSFLFWTSFLCILPIFIFSEFFLKILFGEKYVAGVNILRITVLSIPFVALGMLQGRFFINQMKDRLNFFRMIISAIFSLVVSFILIKAYGIIGAAYAYLVSQLFTSFIVDLFFRETIKDFKTKLLSIVGLISMIDLMKLIIKHYGKRRNEDLVNRV